MISLIIPLLNTHLFLWSILGLVSKIVQSHVIYKGIMGDKI